MKNSNTSTGSAGHKNPSQFKRRILLAVTGLSPQVVTETLFAVAVQPKADQVPFVPTEIHVVTTGRGAEHIRLNLLSKTPGWFHRMRVEYELPEIRFDDSTIHIVTDTNGQPLDDIRTQADNECVADQLASTVRDLTGDETAALHVSLAGGRKTMGYYLGYALSLYGRPQDVLSHVLVSAPFESHPEFFYPSHTQRVIQTREAKPRPLDCRSATVELAEIPYVRMRDGLDEKLLSGLSSFSESVAMAQRSLQTPELILDLEYHRVRAGGVLMKLPPAELAMLSLFARRAHRSESAIAAPQKGVPDTTWSHDYLRELKCIVGEMADRDETERALRSGMDGEYFSSRLSKLRRHLRLKLGVGAVPYSIDDGGTRPRQYRLRLPTTAIRYEQLEAS